MYYAVVTGANKGIGFHIASSLASKGFTTILACRNENLGNEAVMKLKNQGVDNVVFKPLDINNVESINKFATEMNKDFPDGINVLVNNAGMAFKGADPTPHEQQVAPTVKVNYLGTVELTEALLPQLRKASSPRIVNLGSQAGLLRILQSPSLKEFVTQTSLTTSQLKELATDFIRDIENKDYKRGWPKTNYGMSKLLIIAQTRIWAREEPSILVNSCCPGYCATDMSSHRGTKTAAEGALTPTLLATLKDGSTVTGKFYVSEVESDW